MRATFAEAKRRLSIIFFLPDQTAHGPLFSVSVSARAVSLTTPPPPPSLTAVDDAFSILPSSLSALRCSSKKKHHFVELGNPDRL